jgi:hypothetical protein
MIDRYHKTTGELIGQVTEPDLQGLVDALGGYQLTTAITLLTPPIDVIADGRTTEHLVALLRNALGSTDGVDILWGRRAEIARPPTGHMQVRSPDVVDAALR